VAAAHDVLAPAEHLALAVVVLFDDDSFFVFVFPNTNEKKFSPHSLVNSEFSLVATQLELNDSET
jgi:hypothetical protein